MTAAPNDWPVTMPGVDPDTVGTRDPRTPREHAARLLDDAATAPPDEFGSRDLPDNLRRAATTATKATGEVRRHVHAAVARLDQLADDDLIPRAGRDRLAAETRQNTARTLAEVDGRATTALDVLEAGLTATAQPTMPAGVDVEGARQEFRMLLDAATDPAETIRELATGSDQRLAALAASTYGSSYLRSRGVPDDVIRQTAVFVAQAATGSTDPQRRAAALALVKLPELRKRHQKAMHAAHFALGSD